MVGNGDRLQIVSRDETPVHALDARGLRAEFAYRTQRRRGFNETLMSTWQACVGSYYGHL